MEIERTEIPRSINSSTIKIKKSPLSILGACPFPLAALTPVLIHGAAKWPEGEESPFDVALGQLVDGAAIEITRRLDLLVGDDFNAVANAVIAKSTIRSASRKRWVCSHWEQIAVFKWFSIGAMMENYENSMVEDLNVNSPIGDSRVTRSRCRLAANRV